MCFLCARHQAPASVGVVSFDPHNKLLEILTITHCIDEKLRHREVNLSLGGRAGKWWKRTGTQAVTTQNLVLTAPEPASPGLVYLPAPGLRAP